ncbi:MAG TPA: 50S ribosomal protein L32 [Luteimicrobium sp.]|nr:50S ribosomal protein L32 [Luteimicrobium sp.]
MAVPKRKLSRSRTRSRRSQWKADSAQLVSARTPSGETVQVPPRLVRAARRGLL